MLKIERHSPRETAMPGVILLGGRDCAHPSVTCWDLLFILIKHYITWNLNNHRAELSSPRQLAAESHGQRGSWGDSTVRAGHPPRCLLPSPSFLLWSRAFCVCRESRIIKGGGVLKAIQGCSLFWGATPGQ